jgi:hypothetical protein
MMVRVAVTVAMMVVMMIPSAINVCDLKSMYSPVPSHRILSVQPSRLILPSHLFFVVMSVSKSNSTCIEMKYLPSSCLRRTRNT